MTDTTSNVEFTETRGLELFTLSRFNIEKDLPIVYNNNYNVSLFGLQVVHPGDCSRWRHMAEYLNGYFGDTPYATRAKVLRYVSSNRPISSNELKMVHSINHLESVHNSRCVVAHITESWLICILPFCLIRSRLLRPMKWQVAGSVTAAYLAMKAGWSIHLGGGFHHASSRQGDTYCLFADITLMMVHLWRFHDKTLKFLVVDLDAHQGTGMERDIASMPPSRRQNVFVFDMFNSTAHPEDSFADKGCDCKVPLARFTGDSTYLRKLRVNLKSVIKKFKPSLVIYNAGSDCLKNDPLGLMNLSDDALMIRDEMVFKAARRLKAPIVMLTSGGYLYRSSLVVAKSIRNLYIKGIIQGPLDGGPEERQQTLAKYNLRYVASKAPKSTMTIGDSSKTATVASTLKGSQLERSAMASKLAGSKEARASTSIRGKLII